MAEQVNGYRRFGWVDMLRFYHLDGLDVHAQASVIAKRERAVRYCEVASAWCRENEYREWRHLFIPDYMISENSTFAQFTTTCMIK